MIYSSILELIGNTPLLEVKNYSDKYADGARILCKLEYLNPAGSAKDRAAARMIADAEAEGLINVTVRKGQKTVRQIVLSHTLTYFNLLNILLGIYRLKEQELRLDNICCIVIDWRTKKDDAIHHKA